MRQMMDLAVVMMVAKLCFEASLYFHILTVIQRFLS